MSRTAWIVTFIVVIVLIGFAKSCSHKVQGLGPHDVDWNEFDCVGDAVVPYVYAQHTAHGYTVTVAVPSCGGEIEQLSAGLDGNKDYKVVYRVADATVGTDVAHLLIDVIEDVPDDASTVTVEVQEGTESGTTTVVMGEADSESANHPTMPLLHYNDDGNEISGFIYTRGEYSVSPPSSGWEGSPLPVVITPAEARQEAVFIKVRGPGAPGAYRVALVEAGEQVRTFAFGVPL